MESFTPVSALMGGILIGLAAVLLMAVHGRIVGISGIVASAINGDDASQRGWQIAFLIGLMLGSFALWLVQGHAMAQSINTDWPLIIAGGIAVGIGVRLGSGCTSGHGVCGLSRLSIRSVIATLTFMAAGMAVASLLRPFLQGVM
ncbi:MAG: YeeE/YedE family protein [Alphaproteobacteria bacterium]